MSEPTFIFVGSVIVDIVMRIDALPEPGGDIIAADSLVTAGGGFNTMTAAARDGATVVFLGQYGTGPFGTIVRKALDDSGFAVIQSGRNDMDSGYCVALVDASTERTFVTAAGAEGIMNPEGLARVTVGDHDIVYVSGYALAHPDNAAIIPPWLDSLPESVRVITDPGPLIGDLDRETRERVFRRTDILTLNAREARIAGGSGGTAEQARAVAARIRSGGAVVVRDGARGALIATMNDPAVAVPSIPVDAVDSNGAGDAHGGVLSAALLRGGDLVDAVRRANVAAALAVTKVGPATSPTGPEIDAALAVTA